MWLEQNSTVHSQICKIGLKEIITGSYVSKVVNIIPDKVKVQFLAPHPM